METTRRQVLGVLAALAAAAAAAVKGMFRELRGAPQAAAEKPAAKDRSGWITLTREQAAVEIEAHQHARLKMQPQLVMEEAKRGYAMYARLDPGEAQAWAACRNWPQGDGRRLKKGRTGHASVCLLAAELERRLIDVCGCRVLLAPANWDRPQPADHGYVRWTALDGTEWKERLGLGTLHRAHWLPPGAEEPDAA